jgi:hypothetical protein
VDLCKLYDYKFKKFVVQLLNQKDTGTGKAFLVFAKFYHLPFPTIAMKDNYSIVLHEICF